MWILNAFLNPILHALANVIDSFLVNKLFKGKVALIFYAALLNVLFLPFLILFFGIPSLPDTNSILIFLALALINISYLYPYYKALEHNDTSIVVALFSLGKVFVPILAYFLVGEVLSLVQYIGVGIIVIASIILNISKDTKFKMNNSLWWMMLCTIILAVESVLYKMVFLSLDWITGFTWPVVFTFCLSLVFLAIPYFRSDIIESWKTFKNKVHIIAVEELATFLGIAAGTFAVSEAPVTIVTSIYATESIFVLLYAKFFNRFFPNFFKEKIDDISMLKKVLVFIAMGIGIILVVK